jgi:single-stranded DNA-binding protein
MTSLNSVHLIGILGEDPAYADGAYHLKLDTTRLRRAGDQISSIVPRSPGQSSGPTRDCIVTDRHVVTVRRPDLLDSVSRLKRGERLFIDGRLESRTVYDQDGVARQIPEVVALRVEVLRLGVRQDIFNALRLRQQRQREGDAFVAAAVRAFDALERARQDAAGFDAAETI